MLLIVTATAETRRVSLSRTTRLPDSGILVASFTIGYRAVACGSQLSRAVVTGASVVVAMKGNTRQSDSGFPDHAAADRVKSYPLLVNWQRAEVASINDLAR
jgi:hypothetical protein